jgi:hypothetical protein
MSQQYYFYHCLLSLICCKIISVSTLILSVCHKCRSAVRTQKIIEEKKNKKNLRTHLLELLLRGGEAQVLVICHHAQGVRAPTHAV